MFFKMLDKIKKKLSQNILKYTQKEYICFWLKQPHNVLSLIIVDSPISCLAKINFLRNCNMHNCMSSCNFNVIYATIDTTFCAL